jgi:uncharacterized protein (DUF3084 family)
MESSSQSSTQFESEQEKDAIHGSSSAVDQEKLDEILARKLASVAMPRMTRAQLAEAKKLEKKQMAEMKKRDKEIKEREKEMKEREKKIAKQEREKAKAEKKKRYAQEMKERKEGKSKKVVREILGHPSSISGLVKPQGWIGAYSPESRKVRIERFRAKRNHRVWTKEVKYGVRKNFADSRMRIKGRFVKRQDEMLMRDLISLS